MAPAPKRRYLWILLPLAAAAALGLAAAGSAPLRTGQAVEEGRSLAAPARGESGYLLAVATDLHFLAGSLHDRGEAWLSASRTGDGKDLDLVGPMLDALAWDLAASKPDLLVITGDLSLNGEKASHEELAARFARIEANGTKVFVLPGNHDIDNGWARSYLGKAARKAETTSAASFAGIYRDFGWGEAISRDVGTLSYVAQPLPGLRLLMLDSSATSPSEPGGDLPEPTRAWIAASAQAAREAGARLVVALHHSLLDHSPMITVGYTLDGSAALADFFAGLGIGFVLSGHIHIQDISQADTAQGRLYDIATNALSVNPHQYGLLRLDGQGKGMEYSARPLDVEGWARATGQADPRLLGFASHSEAFFRGASAAMADRAASALGAGRSADAEAMAQVLGTLNLRFFAGREDLNATDLASSRGWRLWEEAPPGFLSAYAKSIFADSPPSDNELRIGD